jgi:hypothetical protein
MGDVRWKQRLDIFKKALAQLSEFLAQESLNKFEVQGLIQCFEYTFELGWKTIKDYLEQEGLDVKTPRSAIQTAFHKLGSDVDIALYGNRADWQVVSRIHARLEDESPMPYRFDIVDGTHLEHPELKAHIDRVGQVIYTKKRDR